MSGGPSFLPYGDRAVLVELADTAAAVTWADAVRADPPAGVADLVPGARTVLVLAAEGFALEGLRTSLASVRPAPGATGAGEAGARDPTDGASGADVVEVPTVYDGPDLADVARLTGLSAEEVVQAHTASIWRVAFGGFMPGFGYLADGDPRLEVPRRASARTEVPAGSVGLAGSFSGVYPRTAPGGWQLIGSTDVVLWDLDRDPPALFAPGVAVRFVRADP